MENLRKTIKVRLGTDAKDYKTSFISQEIISKHFVIIHEIKSVLTLNNQSM